MLFLLNYLGEEVTAMPFSYEALGVTIRHIRKEKGLSQEVLSGLAGIARTHLSMIENGAIHASIETVWKIAPALGLRPSELFALVEEAADREP